MPDKDRERHYLEMLAIAMPELQGMVQHDSEAPDFLLEKDGLRLGIEMTVFHLAPPPGRRSHKEQQSLCERVVEQAERFHREAGGPPLYVWVSFGDAQSLDKPSVGRVAAALARAVLRADALGGPAPSRPAVPWEDLPGPIADVRVVPSVDGIDRLWSVSGGAWAAPVEPQAIEAVIAKKARKASRARLKCDALWLVIVEDFFSGAQPVTLTREAQTRPYRHPFDSVLWFCPAASRAIRLLNA